MKRAPSEPCGVFRAKVLKSEPDTNYIDVEAYHESGIIYMGQDDNWVNLSGAQIAGLRDFLIEWTANR